MVTSVRTLKSEASVDAPALRLMVQAAFARPTALSPHLTAAALQFLADSLAQLARSLSDQTRDAPPGQTRLVLGTPGNLDVLLTPREMEIAAGIARGLTNRQIAAELVIALSTTERHVANIMAKLGMRSRAQIAVWAAQRCFADF